MPNLSTAMKATASFTFKNTDSSDGKRLCLFPGHFDTQTIVKTANSSTNALESAVLMNSSISHITAAGYSCDQVAYDYDSTNQVSTDKIQVTPNSARVKWADFLRYIQFMGLKVTKMRIKSLTSSHTIFNTDMEITSSGIGGKAGSDFISLSEYITSSAYDGSFIDIDLAASNLTLDATTLVFLDIPKSEEFTIMFTLEA